MKRLVLLSITVALVSCEGPKPENIRNDSPGGSFVAPESTVTELIPRTRQLTKYGVSSAIVEYRNEALGRNQTFYFDRYGAREAIYTGPGRKGAREVPFDVSIYAGGMKVNYLRATNMGIAKAQPNSPGPLLGTVPDLRTRELVSTGMHTVAGKETQGVSFEGDGARMGLWMWRGVPLRVEEVTPGGDTFLLEAISVREGVAIPNDRFTVPREVHLDRLR